MGETRKARRSRTAHAEDASTSASASASADPTTAAAHAPDAPDATDVAAERTDGDPTPPPLPSANDSVPRFGLPDGWPVIDLAAAMRDFFAMLPKASDLFPGPTPTTGNNAFGHVPPFGAGLAMPSLDMLGQALNVPPPGGVSFRGGAGPAAASWQSPSPTRRGAARAAGATSAATARRRVSRRELEAAVRTLLDAFDPEPEREGLQDTPRRVVAMYQELLVPKPFTFTVFDAEGADQMVVVQGIPFYSLCEHHLAPFSGTAAVAYLPKGKIAGLSKLARTVDYFAHRLQTQERLTNQIANYLMEKLEPHGVGVVLQASHLCMEMRGVQKPGTATVTSALAGSFREQPEVRAEFLALAYGSASAGGMRGGAPGRGN